MLTLSETLSLVRHVQPDAFHALMRSSAGRVSHRQLLAHIRSDLKDRDRFRRVVTRIAEARRKGDAVHLDNLCVVCGRHPHLVAFRECGHLSLCAECAETQARLPSKKRRCPVCRTPGERVCVLVPRE